MLLVNKLLKKSIGPGKVYLPSKLMNGMYISKQRFCLLDTMFLEIVFIIKIIVSQAMPRAQNNYKDCLILSWDFAILAMRWG